MAALVAGGSHPFSRRGPARLCDFTASWCLSCQVNERVACGPRKWSSFSGAQRGADEGRLDPPRRGHHAAFAALDRSGVPAYALYTPGQSDPVMLPEVLTPGIVIDALGKVPKPVH